MEAGLDFGRGRPDRSSMAAPEPYAPPADSALPVLNALLHCVKEVDRVCQRNIEELGITPAQFDVLVTLGDTAGMSCKVLGDEALITRGTLIPVLDRLEAKGLISRCKGESDSRQTIVRLTEEGQSLYERAFKEHVAFVRPYLDRLNPQEQSDLIRLLGKLGAAFSQG